LPDRPHPRLPGRRAPPCPERQVGVGASSPTLDAGDDVAVARTDCNARPFPQPRRAGR
jgi:hypothetical protein